MTRENSFFENQILGWVGYGARDVLLPAMKPDIFQIETTSICNLRCVFCPYDKLARKKEHMSFEKFKKFLNSQCEHIKSVGLHHFGEPFLNKDLFKFVELCKQLGMDSTLSTNATILDEKLIAATLKAGLTRLIISLDGSSQKNYERLRLGAIYSEVLSTIDCILEIKKKFGLGTYIQIQFIITPENKSEIESFKEIWERKEGVDQVVFRDERTHAGQVVRHDEYSTRNDNRRHPCRYLWESLVVLSNGDVVPCCKDINGKVVLGNVFNGDDLQMIWNSPAMVELRESHISEKFDKIDLCKNCNEWPGHAELGPNESKLKFIEFRNKKKLIKANTVQRRDFE